MGSDAVLSHSSITPQTPHGELKKLECHLFQNLFGILRVTFNSRKMVLLPEFSLLVVL